MGFNIVPDIPLNTRFHVCAACGTERLRPIPGAPERHERWVDTGVFIDNQGAIGFCESCMSAVASALGWVRADQHARLDALLGDALQARDATGTRAAALQEENEALRRAIRIRDAGAGE